MIPVLSNAARPAVMLALLGLLAGTPLVQADDSCSSDEAAEQLSLLYDQINTEAEPELEKEKRGYVRVARSAEPHPALADPQTRARLNAELKRAAAMLARKPDAVCAAVSRIRDTYGL